MAKLPVSDGHVQLSFIELVVPENELGVSEEEHLLVEQVTLYNLKFTRELLRKKGLRSSGTRDVVRKNCIAYLKSAELVAADLWALLAPLEMWGNQRVRLLRFSDKELAPFQSREATIERARLAELEHLIDEKLPLIVPNEVRPLSIRYVERDDRRLLILIAGKVREVWIYQHDLPNREDELDPEIVYRPFKRELQNTVSFAEIDLDSGDALISTKLLRTGTGYAAEFDELYRCFEPLFQLADATTVDLYRATKNTYTLDTTEVRIRNQRSLTSSGGTASFTSHSSLADVRSDSELDHAQRTLGTDAPGDYCNCNWLRNGELSEDVHVYLHGASGEVSIHGQVREESVRYVLQRVQSVNQ